MRAAAALLAMMLLAGCNAPPPEAYAGGAASGAGVGIGRNASNEACTQQARAGAGDTVDVFCGAWQQPSASVTRAGPGGPDALAGLAAGSAWRSALDTRYVCAAPQPTTVLDAPALVMACNRRVGGWPQVALVTSIGGQLYEADGIQPALPVIPRAIGVLSGRISAEAAPALPRSGAEALLASRLAAQSFSAGDIGQFEQLIQAGTNANLAESYAAAEDVDRAALALQQKVLGRDVPDQANTLALLALQLSNQGRYAEADGVFARAATFAPRAADPAVPARLLHYRALNEWNQHHDQAALDLLRQAEARYAALVPPEALANGTGAGDTYALAQTGTARVNNPVPDANTVVEPTQQSAIIGMVETRRYQAIVLRAMGRPADSDAAIRSAARLALSQGMRQPVLTARLFRTAATSAAARGEVGDAVTGLGLSSNAFTQALPGTRPLASTELLRAARLRQDGRDGAALDACRRAARLLRDLKTGAPQDLVEPCLDIYAAAAARAGDGQAILAEMFEASQQGQGSVTGQEIARSAARLGETARDPKVGAAIRRRQDAGSRLAELTRQRDALSQPSAAPSSVGAPRSAADLDAAITEARTQLADADAALQAASPNFGQLVQEVAPAADVFAALRPGEAFASISLGSDAGWLFVLRDGRVTAAKLGASPAAIDAQVRRFRASVEPGDKGPPEFDAAAAQALYAATLGQAAPQLEGATSLIVAPAGPLLSVPFAALLTGPAGPDLAAAPWLIKRMAVAHVPAAANFVSLRRVAGTSRATRPWFGLGDFRPVTLAQAQRSFPAGACQDSAQLFAGLPRLAFAGRELEAARVLLGGAKSDELLGDAYTVQGVRQAGLKQYRILHFAAHALLPAELRCSAEPAIITSAPPGAADASGALLTATLVSGLDLDADAVILSACNSAGPGGPAGESLSGLARAFFYAGARAMMVTHWSVNDQASAFLVADTLRRVKAGKDGGFAGSLRGAQLGLLAEAGRGLPAAIAHPFFWAPFALIGEGGTRSLGPGGST